MPPSSVYFWRPTRYQELDWSKPRFARISSGLRWLTMPNATARTANQMTATFQNFRNGNSPRIIMENAASIMGPPAMATRMPTGSAVHQGTIQGKSLRFSQKRFVDQATRIEKNHPNMMHWRKGHCAR